MNPKRGYLPKDEIYFSQKALATMQTAARHIRYLLNEEYDLKSVTTFVGNHYSFCERQRLALMRGVASDEQLKNRLAKKRNSVSGGEVWIDGFNTIITLEVMLSASLLFDCMDGTIRDLAALRGSYRIIPETGAAIELLLSTLAELQADAVHILLDKPVSNSGRLKSLIAELGENFSFSLDIQLLDEVDKTLWAKENVITSDSIILDHCQSWFNLTKICAKKRNARLLRVW